MVKKKALELLLKQGLDIFQVIDTIIELNGFTEDEFLHFQELVNDYLHACAKELYNV